MAVSPNLITMKGITKSFPGVVALEDVDFALRQGEVHALMGENGAGKSTLIKVLTGVEHPDSGSIELNGKAVQVHSPQHSQVLGISTSGGDARFTTISPLAKRNDINVPTGFNAMSINVTLGHDPANANYQQMLDISRTLEKVAFKMVLSGGAVAYGYGYMSVSEAPQLNRNQANQVNAAITLLGRFMSYAV